MNSNKPLSPAMKQALKSLQSTPSVNGLPDGQCVALGLALSICSQRTLDALNMRGYIKQWVDSVTRGGRVGVVR